MSKVKYPETGAYPNEKRKVQARSPYDGSLRR
jgi:hypothetical protein